MRKKCREHGGGGKLVGVGWGVPVTSCGSDGRAARLG